MNSKRKLTVEEVRELEHNLGNGCSIIGVYSRRHGLGIDVTHLERHLYEIRKHHEVNLDRLLLDAAVLGTACADYDEVYQQGARVLKSVCMVAFPPSNRYGVNGQNGGGKQ